MIYIYRKYINFLLKNDVLVYNKSNLSTKGLLKHIKKNRIIFIFLTITIPFIILKIPFPFKSTFEKYINNIIILYQREQI